MTLVKTSTETVLSDAPDPEAPDQFAGAEFPQPQDFSYAHPEPKTRVGRPLKAVAYVGAIAAGIVTLGLLVVLSTSEQPQLYRQLDTTVRHLSELTDAADQGLALATQPSVRNVDLRPLGSLYTDGVDRLGNGLRPIYRPDGDLANLRQLATAGFNAISFDPAPEADRVMDNYSSLRGSVQVFAATVSAFSDNREEFMRIRADVDTGGRKLVQRLREQGRSGAADEIYDGVQQLLDRAGVTGDNRVDAVITRLSRPIDGVNRADRRALTDLLARAGELPLLQAQMKQQIDLMGVDSLRGQLDRLRQQTTSDYLYVLSTMSDARVLLNIYTVLLLCVLVHFGWRLNRSYAELNRSHDELEIRVHERTADLEQALEDLKESQVQLVQAEKMSSLGQLVAGVMHEINTPLLYVLNNTKMSAEMVDGLKEYVDATAPLLGATPLKDLDTATLIEDIEEVQTLANDSTEGLHVISELVQSLKDFSRLDRVAEDRFDVREGIEKTLLITKNLLKYGVEVERDFREVPDIFCSPSRLNQVFTNLITNAAQAMDGQGKLTIRTRATGDWVEIVFEDTGCGIPQEHINKIMDPVLHDQTSGSGYRPRALDRS